MGAMVLVKVFGMPLISNKGRKDSTCKLCREIIAKGVKVWRPLLQESVNGIIRCNRFCQKCVEEHGHDKRYLDD